MRRALIALVCLIALPAAAQTSAPTPDLTRAMNALAAMWRPIDGPFTVESVRAACSGAEQEMQALDAAMPAELNAESAARVRGLRGLHIVPIASRPGAAYFFPPLGLTWFTPGLGEYALRDESQGYFDVRDASGQVLAVQRVRAGNLPVLRIHVPGTDQLATFVGCQPIAPLE